MGDRVQAALSRAHALLHKLHDETIEKTIFGSPAGKKRLAPRLVKLLPPHRVYVEPFAGSAAVLFGKEPSEVEVINDADPEIAKAYQILQKLSPAKIEALRAMSWTGDESTFKKLLDAEPRAELEQLYRFLYLTHFSYGKMRGRTFSPNVQGIEAKTIGRIDQFAPRLAKVKVYSGDYAPVVRRYDGPDTAFFLDPPYPGYNVDVGESDFDEERFFEVLQSLKGKWLMTYGVRGKLPGLLKEAGYFIKRIRTPRTIGAMRGVGGPSVLTQLLVANYEFVEKACDLDLEPWEHIPSSPKPQDPSLPAPSSPKPQDPSLNKFCPLLKDLDPDDERYVLGVVLVPERVDAQGDVYSQEEVRHAAHRFMEEFGGIGLMHQLRVNDQVKVLESYLAPVEVQVGEVLVPKGTWLLAVRVQSDELWERVRNGELTGFSIGGSARRVPEEAVGRSPEAGGSVEKAAPQVSSLKPQVSINRLIDIVVEEVSLVDRAANEHRFLIVKRDTPMTDSETNSDDLTDLNDLEAADHDTLDSGPADPLLASAVAALEGLTRTVELLGTMGAHAADNRLTTIAQDLKSTADGLLSRAGVATQGAQAHRPDADENRTTPTFEAQLASTRDALAQLANLTSATAVPAPNPAGPALPPELTQGLAAITDSFRALADTVKEQQQRLNRVEKQFGLPNSTPGTERIRKAEPEDIGWPMDLNHPMDRESVDKAVSFHDL